MKVAFHFQADHSALNRGYGRAIEEFLRLVLHDPAVILHSKVFLGNLLLTRLGYRREGTTEVFDESRYLESFNRWAFPESGVWSRMTLDTLAWISTEQDSLNS